MTYFLVQLGCQMNHSDAERIAAVLEAMGFRRAGREEDASLLGIIACSVRQKAIDRVYSRITLWNSWKLSRNLLTFVSGCILPEDHEKFLDRFDLVFSINELPQVPSMIRTYGVPVAIPQAQDRVEAARMLAEELKAASMKDHAAEEALGAGSGGGPEAERSGGRPREGKAAEGSVDGTGDGKAAGVRAPARASAGAREGLEPENVGPNRPSGPLWLKEAPGISLQMGPLTGEAHMSRRKIDAAAVKRLAGLSTLKVIQDELSAQGEPEGNAAADGKGAAGGSGSAGMQAFWHIRPAYESSFEASIPIQNGCDKFCTFCAVPYTRGREVSRPSADIMDELGHLVDRGYRSITLLGQNVNSYGKDKHGSEPGFAELLDRIGRLGEEKAREGKRFWVYFTSPHPRDMDRAVLETMARWPCLAKQVHLPLQSGDDKLLLRMNRNHSMDRYRGIVADIRELMPEATLFTDIIVGFSGESVEQFESTRAAMEEFSYQMAFVSPYSPRPGAAASRWDDDVPHEEKKRRLQVLTEVLHRTSRQYNEGLVGREMTVLVKEMDSEGRWYGALTEGRVNLRFPVPADLDSSQGPSGQGAAEDPGSPGSLVGRFTRVRVSSARTMSLEAQWCGRAE